VKNERLTTASGAPVGDDQNSLMAVRDAASILEIGLCKMADLPFAMAWARRSMKLLWPSNNPKRFCEGLHRVPGDRYPGT
jgi:hypothetical protein